MKDTIFLLEDAMWQAAKCGDKARFLRLVSADAVMICGGYRCSGEQYAGFVSDFGIAEYEISGFEIVSNAEEIVQVHYLVKTVADSEKNADLAGTFHVTSTWKKISDSWQLIFNMDQRIS